MSTLAWTPSLAPATLTNVRMAWAVRPAAADDPAHVVGGDVEAEPQPAPALLGVDDDRVRVVGQRPGQVGEHGQRRAARRLAVRSLPSPHLVVERVVVDVVCRPSVWLMSPAS